MEATPWRTDPPPQPAPAAPQSGCLHAVLFAIACAWVVGVTMLGQLAAWFFEQYQLIGAGATLPAWYWVAVALGQATLLMAVAMPLARFVRAPWFRAAYRTWTVAIGFGALLSLARLNPVTWTQPAAVAQIVLALLATVAVLRWPLGGAQPQDRSSITTHTSSLVLALATGLAVILPWVRSGALGSPLDTLLNLLAAACLGLFAGVLLERFLLAPIVATTGNPYAAIGTGGVAAGVALLVLGAGFGYGGSQIPLAIGLLPLGGAAAALGWRAQAGGGRGRAPIAWLVGAAAAGPLLFLDPDEFSLALSEEIGWVFRTAWLSFFLAAGVGLALWLLVARRPAAPAADARPARASMLVPLGALAAAVAVAVVIYAGGRPGFYGERIFVIMRDQADLSQASVIGDRTERGRFVYKTLTDRANTSQAGIRATLDRFGVAYTPYYLVNAIEVDAGPLVRAYLSAQPEVDRIVDSPQLRPLEAAPVPSDNDRLDIAPPDIDTPPPPTGVQWNVAAIGADRVWSELGVNGAGIVLGQSDSGVQGDHPALRDGYRGRASGDDYNWLDPWNGSRSPVDVGGHGTHTTGTVVGREGVGVAPGAEWIGCVNLARNLGNPAFYLDCMQFMLAPFPQGGNPLADGDPARAPHVLNNSWGCPPLEGCDPESLAPAVHALRTAGIFVVASAGNAGPACSSVSDPIAIYDDAFSVGATDRSGQIADFSSRGPVAVDGSNRIKPDIVAPGVNIVSSLPGNRYGPNNGTSMAGPHVAGVVALMWSAQPRLVGDVDRTEQILRDTASPYTGELSRCGASGTPNDTAGYGVVDAYAAVRAAQALP